MRSVSTPGDRRPLVPTLATIFAASLVYPFFWYLIHRYVLHSRWMFKVPLLAATWKRIHYDHHQDPNHLEVLFGALHTTLPTIALGVFPLGYAIGGLGGGMIALATGLLTTCLYEYRPLHPAPRLQAEEPDAGGNEEASPRPSFP